MSHSKKHPHLICYDIADKKRLQRVHRLVSEKAIPLQYSVYLAHLKKSQCQRLIDKLETIINPEQDDIRIYPLPKNPEWSRWGKQLFSEGLLLAHFPLPKNKSKVE
jgi:CRISPR-associated protein Cas2